MLVTVGAAGEEDVGVPHEQGMEAGSDFFFS